MQNPQRGGIRSAIGTMAMLLGLGMLADVASAAPVVVMDQIGADPADAGTTNDSRASQDFEPADDAFDTVVVDDFTVTADQLDLIRIEAVFAGFNGFSSGTQYASVQGWQVQIYSSVASALSSLVGDVASVVVAPASVTLTTPYNPAVNTSALVSIPVSITLPTAGTYYLGVMARMDFNPGSLQVGINNNTFASPIPGGANAIQVNPGGAFSFPGNQRPTDGNASYRITADAEVVPEPASVALMGLGLVGLVVARRRRGRAA